MCITQFFNSNVSNSLLFQINVILFLFENLIKINMNFNIINKTMEIVDAYSKQMGESYHKYMFYLPSNYYVGKYSYEKFRSLVL